MENAKQARNLLCLLLTFPLQGHVNPLLQFSKRLKHKGIARITLAVTKFFLKTAQNFTSNSFPVETISDGLDDGGADKIKPVEYYNICWKTGSETLAQLIERLRSSGSGVDCLIYDPFYPWALDVAKKFGLKAAMFFTQSNSVNCIYLQAYKREMELPVTAPEIRIPGGLPVLRREDLPSFICEYESNPEIAEMMIRQFRNVDMVDWIFVNTFYELEKEVIDYMAKNTPVKAIGPTIPSMYLDKRLPDDKDYGLSLFKPMIGACSEWLNERQPRSVIYVSFGSLAKLEDKQMGELARGLRLSNKHFLWVVRETEQSKLPKNFAEESSEKGLIVPWCPQLDVLLHEAICCFVTHCGWNSTLEALSLGVPMVGVPQWTDQATNSKFVMDVWKMGVRARADENGLVSGETIASCVGEVMEGERGEEIRKNAIKWKELAREAMGEGGSSDLDIQEFVCSLLSS